MKDRKFVYVDNRTPERKETFWFISPSILEADAAFEKAYPAIRIANTPGIGCRVCALDDMDASAYGASIGANLYLIGTQVDRPVHCAKNQIKERKPKTYIPLKPRTPSVAPNPPLTLAERLEKRQRRNARRRNDPRRWPPGCNTLEEAAAWRRETLSKLVARDGARCCWCQRMTLRTRVTLGQDLFPTIEHVIPKKDGGSDDMSNLKVACLYCNSNRHNANFVLPK